MSSRLSGYLTVIVGEWLLILMIWLALRRRGSSISSLVSGRWQTLGNFFRDLGLALGFMVVVIPTVAVVMHLLGAKPDSTLANILPKTWFELAVWLGLSATGGFCEELIFRGYLTRQFGGWTGSRAMGHRSARCGLWPGPWILRPVDAGHHGSRMSAGSAGLLA